MADSLRLRALVVQSRVVGEQDVLLTLLGVGKGKLQAVAKGAKKQNARLSGAAQVFFYGDFLLEESRSRWYVKEASPIEMFFKLRTDLDLLSWAAFMTETASIIAQEEEPCDEMMKTVLKGMMALQNAQLDPLNTACACVLRILILEGALSDPQDIEAFRSDPAFRIMRLSSGAVCAIHYFFEQPLEKLYAFRLSKELQQELFSFMRRLLVDYLQQEPKSLTFIVSTIV